MTGKLLNTSALVFVLLSDFSFVPLANAQTVQDEVNRTNDLITNIQHQADSIFQQAQQEELQNSNSTTNLFNRCMAGDMIACDRHKVKMQ